MTYDRSAQIGKFGVLIIAAIILLAIVLPRSGPRADVKPVASRKAVPDFTLRDLDGGDWQLSLHRGEVVLVNFWASWCSPCREETPGLLRVAHAYAPKGLTVAGISMDQGGVEPVRKFIHDYGVDYPIMMHRADFLMGNEVEYLPTTLLIDRKGRLAKTYQGGKSEAVFKADVEKVLAEPAS